MQAVQRQIAEELKVQPPFSDTVALEAEVLRRIKFIQCCLQKYELKTLVLGISGGVDSLAAGLIAQCAVKQLREQTNDQAYRFIAVRLPYGMQHDAIDATAAVNFINPDERQTVNIGPAVKVLAAEVSAFDGKPNTAVDFVLGNAKARMRMVAQYIIAGATAGLVVGTDHAAEAVMGFFTKFGDGSCDLAPLSGLVKNQVRAIARHFGAPEFLVEKVPTADLEDLEPGKPDEVSHGVTYAEIDAFLHGQPVSQGAFNIICRMYKKTQHKREMPLTP